jgi:hypothetical protein
MNKKGIARGFMAAGGIVEIVIAIVHFVWPFQLVHYGQFAELSVDYQNLLILSSLAIGVCLTLFGFLSIHFSRRLVRGERSAWIFGMSQGVLWEVRAALEVLYPVKVPLFFITKPTVFVLPMAVLLGLMYLIPLLLIRRELGVRGRDKGI